MLRSDGRLRPSVPPNGANLAALAINLDRVVSVDRLMTIVWNGDPLPTARASLQGHIAQLRKNLGDGVKLGTVSPATCCSRPARCST
ncbi:AfsR/SARP family transcriptional regulator [Saccharopolyspora sp. NPDC000995]